MARVGMKKNINIGRVVAKIAGTVIALYVGGTVLTEFGNVMNCTYSPFYKGLTLIGWTVSTVTHNGTGYAGNCNSAITTAGTYNNVITATTGSGILSVVGLIGIASIVMEFVEFRL